jgi:hypothetical protein
MTVKLAKTYQVVRKCVQQTNIIFWLSGKYSRIDGKYIVNKIGIIFSDAFKN